jgi:hypothetical protein
MARHAIDLNRPPRIDDAGPEMAGWTGTNPIGEIALRPPASTATTASFRWVITELTRLSDVFRSLS